MTDFFSHHHRKRPATFANPQAARGIHLDNLSSCPSKFINKGIVVTAPTPTSVQPTARRWSLLSFPDNNNPIPAPNIARVLATKPISGIVSLCVFIITPFFLSVSVADIVFCSRTGKVFGGLV
jgi:hypothetical protein